MENALLMINKLDKDEFLMLCNHAGIEIISVKDYGVQSADMVLVELSEDDLNLLSISSDAIASGTCGGLRKFMGRFLIQEEKRRAMWMADNNYER
jgi:hypothetical protein